MITKVSDQDHCILGNFHEDFIFANMRSFVKIGPSRNNEIPLSFTDVGKSCHSREFSKSQICLLTLFAKIKFSRNFPNLQYDLVSVLWLITQTPVSFCN